MYIDCDSFPKIKYGTQNKKIGCHSIAFYVRKVAQMYTVDPQNFGNNVNATVEADMLYSPNADRAHCVIQYCTQI